MSSGPAEMKNEDPSRANLAFLLCGYFLFALGLLGTLLPVLPTTVFWIAAALCFMRSSPKMYRTVVTWPVVGKVVEDFVVAGVINRKSKLAALLGMSLAAVLVVLAPLSGLVTLLTLAAIVVGAGYVLSRPERLVAPGS